MHILVILLSVVAGVATWYFRAQQVSKAAGEVIDAASHLRGAYRRRKFRQKVDASLLAAIEDPGLAAAVALVHLAESGRGWNPTKEKAIADWLRDEVAYPDITEAITFGRWVSREIADTSEVVRKLLPLWQSKLGAAERQEFLLAARRVAALDGQSDPANLDALRRLEEGLATR